MEKILGLPVLASEHGKHVDTLIIYVHWLMALLFVGGVMNIAWIALLSLFVLAEKLVPRATWLPRFAGLVLVGAGAWMLIATTA